MKIKAYIAGPLCTEQERKAVEEIESICAKIGFRTFLPHRDCGLWNKKDDAKKIARGDILGFKDCSVLVANLNGFNVGAGTAWEMGYAFSKGIPIIAIKTDRKVEDSLEEISAIIFGTTRIVTSFKDLEKELKEIINKGP